MKQYNFNHHHHHRHHHHHCHLVKFNSVLGIQLKFWLFLEHDIDCSNFHRALFVSHMRLSLFLCCTNLCTSFVICLLLESDLCDCKSTLSISILLKGTTEHNTSYKYVCLRNEQNPRQGVYTRSSVCKTFNPINYHILKVSSCLFGC